MAYLMCRKCGSENSWDAGLPRPKCWKCGAKIPLARDKGDA
jgi:ribosomal protein L40E